MKSLTFKAFKQGNLFLSIDKSFEHNRTVKANKRASAYLVNILTPTEKFTNG